MKVKMFKKSSSKVKIMLNLTGRSFDLGSFEAISISLSVFPFSLTLFSSPFPEFLWPCCPSSLGHVTLCQHFDEQVPAIREGNHGLSFLFFLCTQLAFSMSCPVNFWGIFDKVVKLVLSQVLMTSLSRSEWLYLVSNSSWKNPCCLARYLPYLR
jgi:hypothetical protein